MGPGCFGWGVLWGFPWIMVFIVAFVFCLVFILWGRRPWSGRGGQDRDDRSQETPLEILKKRYARGEITREDFERMKKDVA
jgi:putative membrane protein